MIWSLILLVAIWLGYEILDPMAPEIIDPVSLLAISIPFGCTVMSWIFIFVRMFAQISWVHGIIISLFLACVLGMVRMIFGYMRKPRKMWKIGKEFFVTMGICFLLFIIIIDKSIMKRGNYSSGTVFSDLPFHLSLISSFAYGANNYGSKMMTPFYAGEELSYPIIPDFFSSVLAGAGMAPLRLAIALPTLFILMSLAILVYRIASMFSPHKYAPELTVATFLTASGVGWKWAFIKDCRDNPNANMAHCFCTGKHTFWIHPLIHFLMPQRSALFSMPLAVAITILLIYVTRARTPDKKALVMAGVLMGVLPMISAHSFIGVGEYAIFICIAHFPWRYPKVWMKAVLFWAIFGGVAIAIGGLQVLWLLRVPRQGFGKISPIWLETFPGQIGKFAQLWWESLGPFVVIALVICWPVLTKTQIMAYLPSIGVFVVSNFIRYQPGAMDNNKVFFAGWYTIACCIVSHTILTLWNHGNILLRYALGFVVLGYMASSVFTIGKAIRLPFMMYTPDEMLLGQWVMENTLKNSVVMGSSWHANTAMSLGGRLVTLGYGGWVWTHGLNYGSRDALMKKMIQHREDEEMFKPLNIQYAMAKNDDHTRGYNWTVPETDSRWVKVVDVGTAQLYRLLNIK